MMWRPISITIVAVATITTSVTGWTAIEPDTLNRREALSRAGGLLYGGITTTTLSVPKIANADETSTSTSLLSDYKPLAYKTLPNEGRSVFPPPFLPPISDRATYRYSLGRDTWALEQLIAFANVTATIRTNVVKLSNGRLWVCGPLWPTDEYCKLLDELGQVSDVVLPVNALEHKAPMKQFLAKYPEAKVWVAPGQYGPFGECKTITADMSFDEMEKVVRDAVKTMGHRVDGILPPGSLSKASADIIIPKNLLPSWIDDDEFRVETLYVELPQNAGPVSECVFYHKPTSSLLVTDAVVCVPSATEYPIQPIFSTYFDESILSDPAFWPRTVLQAVFLPLRAENGSYPGYEALANRLVRAPILRAFADARAPDAVRQWVDNIAQSDKFDRIITSHFASPISASNSLFAKAFAHLDENASIESLSAALPPITCKDWSTLDSLNSFIEENKLGAPVVYDFKVGCR